jgi:predicted O-methyltransferase YrrM
MHNILNETFWSNIEQKSLTYNITSFKHPGNWSLHPATCKFLGYLIKTTQFKKIIEFGSGYSTLIMANEIKNLNDSIIISIENSPHYSFLSEKKLVKNNLIDKTLFYCFPLTFSKYNSRFLISYNIPTNISDLWPKFDFALIDAPSSLVGREAALYQLFPFLKEGAIIVLDDANRKDMESVYLKKWAFSFGNSIEIFYLPNIGNGLAIIIKKKNCDKLNKLSLKTNLITSLKTLINLSRFKKKLNH